MFKNGIVPCRQGLDRFLGPVLVLPVLGKEAGVLERLTEKPGCKDTLKSTHRFVLPLPRLCLTS